MDETAQGETGWCKLRFGRSETRPDTSHQASELKKYSRALLILVFHRRRKSVVFKIFSFIVLEQEHRIEGREGF